MEMTDEIRSIIKGQLTARPGPSKNPTRRRTAGIWTKPFASEALGVSPDKIDDARAQLKAHGVAADFDHQGRLVVTSDKQYREAGKALGMWNGRDGWRSYDSDGNPILTGREQQAAKEEWKRKVLSGEIEV